MQRIGFIGFGEAAFHIATGLKGCTDVRISAYDKFWNVEPQGRLVQERAASAGVALAEDLASLVENADIVLSTVSATVAESIAAGCAPHLSGRHLYADLNSAGPATKTAVERIIAPSAAGFADIAIMGTVPGLGHRVPMLASGPGAATIADALSSIGMNITVLEGPAGKASASKMLRSIFMKGVVALLLETVMAGRAYGIEDDLLQSISDTFAAGPFLEVANGLMTRGVIHAERRAHEMDEVIACLSAIDADDTMSKATREKLLQIAAMGFKQHFHGKPPADYHEIFNLA